MAIAISCVVNKGLVLFVARLLDIVASSNSERELTLMFR